jgi:hypothetical protein
MSIAITFTKAAESVVFHDDEVRLVKMTPVNRIQMRRTQTNAPHLYAAGDVYSEVEVMFVVERGDTRDRIASVCDGEEWSCAYRYGENPDDKILVRSTTDAVVDSYVGIRGLGTASEARRTMSVTFVESSA